MPNDSDFVEIRKQVLGITPITRKEAAEAIYKSIREGKQNFEDLPIESQAALKKFMGEDAFPVMVSEEVKAKRTDEQLRPKLKTDADRLKADTNGDKLLSQQEYDTYVVKASEPKPMIDNSVLIALGLVCITIIVLAWLRYKRQKN